MPNLNGIDKDYNVKIGYILLLLIPFFRPDFVSSMYEGSIIDLFFIVWRLGAFTIIMSKFFSSKAKTYNITLILALLYEIFLLFSVYYNHVSLGYRFINLGNCIGILMLYIYYARIAPTKLIKANFIYFSFLIITNAILTLIFPHGLNESAYDSARINFLGKDNHLSLIFLITVVFCVLYSNIYRKSLTPLFVLGIIILTEFYYFSGTGMVALTVLIIYLLILSKSKAINQFIKPITVLILYLIIEGMFVFLQNIENFSFIFKILGKDATFTDRIYYWDAGIAQFLNSPIIGCGSGIVNLWDNGYYSHNVLLDVLMKGGLIGAILWLAMVFVPFFKLKLHKNKTTISFMSVVLLSFLMVGLMEGLEDRIEFNALIALASILEHIKTDDLMNDNRLIRAGIKFRIR